MRFTTQRHGAPDNARVALKNLSPKMIAEHGHRRAVRDIFEWREFLADERRHAQHAEEAGSYALLLRIHRPAISGEIHPSCKPREDCRIKCLRMIADKEPGLSSMSIIVGPSCLITCDHQAQPVRVRISKRP